MTDFFERNLSRLRNVAVAVAADDIPEADGTAHIVVKFSDGTVLKAAYWRLIQDGRASWSSFDHQQQYGLPAPIDAEEKVISQLDGKICSNVQFDSETADLTLVFGKTTKLQVFNFTGYEIWDIIFPDGTGEYSNSALTNSARK